MRRCSAQQARWSFALDNLHLARRYRNVVGWICRKSGEWEREKENLKFKFIARDKKCGAKSFFFIFLHSTPNDVTLRTPRPTELLELLHV